MKRLLAAVGLALLVHGMVFLADFDWFPDRIVPPRISQFVTVTMSYRHKVVEEALSRETPEPNKIEAPKPPQKKVIEKQPKKPLEPHVAKPGEQEFVSGVQQEEVSDAPRRKEASIKDNGGATGRVQEAVPLYKINPPPRYPRTARRRGAQGTVILSVYVDAQGRVDNLWVFESSGFRVLDNAALEGVKKWSFEPGRKGDTKVAMWVNVPVRFELQ